MSIESNPIYKHFLAILDSEKIPHRTHFSADPQSNPKYVEFFDTEGALISRLDIDISHNDFVDMRKQFSQWHYRMKQSNVDNS